MAEERWDTHGNGSTGALCVEERLLGSESHRILTLAPCATLICDGPVKAMKQILLHSEGPFDTEPAIRFLQLKPFQVIVGVGSLLTVLPWTEPPWPRDSAAAAATEGPGETNRVHRGCGRTSTRHRFSGARSRRGRDTVPTMILQQATTYDDFENADLRASRSAALSQRVYTKRPAGLGISLRGPFRRLKTAHGIVQRILERKL